jgi:hypothetical protein
MEAIAILEMIKLIGASCGALITIMGFLGVILKKPRKWITDIMKEATKDEFDKIHVFINKTEKTDLTTLRHEITLIYEKYRDKKEIPMRMRENLCSLYEDYVQRGGNSYVKTIYEEMLDWKVI